MTMGPPTPPELSDGARVDTMRYTSMVDQEYWTNNKIFCLMSRKYFRIGIAVIDFWTPPEQNVAFRCVFQNKHLELNVMVRTG